MSSTKRGHERLEQDYYRTPIHEIEKFLKAFNEKFPLKDIRVIDPCAGGDPDNYVMPYPEALKKYTNKVYTIDIRDDSPAMEQADYLKIYVGCDPDLIISNPPFSQAQEFIDKALDEVRPGGYVVMLLRLNFLGSQKRRNWWKCEMPKYVFVHPNRMSFTPNGKTDSIEYAHFVWKKDEAENYAKLYIL
jgi:hypothetical protein